MKYTEKSNRWGKLRYGYGYLYRSRMPYSCPVMKDIIRKFDIQPHVSRPDTLSLEQGGSDNFLASRSFSGGAGVENEPD